MGTLYYDRVICPKCGEPALEMTMNYYQSTRGYHTSVYCRACRFRKTVEHAGGEPGAIWLALEALEEKMQAGG